jgi:hypothetical protein
LASLRTPRRRARAKHKNAVDQLGALLVMELELLSRAEAFGEVRPGAVPDTTTRRPESGKGSGLRRTVPTTLNIPTTAPIASARVATEVTRNTGVRASASRDGSPKPTGSSDRHSQRRTLEDSTRTGGRSLPCAGTRWAGSAPPEGSRAKSVAGLADEDRSKDRFDAWLTSRSPASTAWT